MPKKPAKNAFFYFMIKYKEEKERHGKRYTGGLAQVSQECAGLWQRLSAAEKEKYVKMANVAKNNTTGGEKYTSQGISLTIVANEQKALHETKNRIKNTIEQVISNAVLADNLELTTISIISFNYFCQSHDQTYTPAEAAVINFNLENGIIDNYHTLINPISLPLGMAFEAKNHSEDTHKLPIPPEALGETNYGRIYDNLYSFIYDDELNAVRPVFTRDSDVIMVKSILNILAVEADKPLDLIDVFPIHEFFYELKKATARLGQTMSAFPSNHLAKACLERDAYEFHSSLACEKHEDIDSPNCCSLSIVKRWAFTIADNCCLDLNINLVPGQHIPIDAKIPDFKFDSEYDSFKAESIKKDDDDDTLYESSNVYSNSDFSRRGRYYDGVGSSASIPMSSTVKEEADADEYDDKDFITVSKRKVKSKPWSYSNKRQMWLVSHAFD